MSHASARDCGEDHWPGKESCWEDRHWGRERSQTGLLPPHPSAMTRRQGCENIALAAKITEAKSDVCTQGLRWEVRRRKASLPSPAASPGPPRTVGGDGIGGMGTFPCTLPSPLTSHLSAPTPPIPSVPPPFCPLLSSTGRQVQSLIYHGSAKLPVGTPQHAFWLTNPSKSHVPDPFQGCGDCPKCRTHRRSLGQPPPGCLRSHSARGERSQCQLPIEHILRGKGASSCTCLGGVSGRPDGCTGRPPGWRRLGPPGLACHRRFHS